MTQAASVTSLADWATAEKKEVSSKKQKPEQDHIVTGGSDINGSVDPRHPRGNVQPLSNEGLGS